MGLLDNLRRKAAEAEGSPDDAAADETFVDPFAPVDGSAPGNHSDQGDVAPPVDDAWLSGVERRDPAPNHSASVNSASYQNDEEGALLYSGLETNGVTAYPQQAPSAATRDPFVAESPFLKEGFTPHGSAPVLSAFPSIEDGPIGPEAVPHLHALGLSVGCSWQDVASARRQNLAALTGDGTPDDLHHRMEINHAAATLRLLRVGPLNQ